MNDRCILCGRPAEQDHLTCIWCEHEPQWKGIRFELQKPTNPLRPFTPYPSKYFIDRRFDPPKPITADDIYRAMGKLKGDKYD